MLALELNDVELALVRGSDVLQREPGFAHVAADHVMLGAPAMAQARLTPILTHSRYWQELSTQPLPRPGKQLATFADLAYAQLAALKAAAGEEADVLIAAPAHYNREQLGLLLGIATEAGFSVAGLIDAAVAASANASSQQRILHLDIYLHHAVVTVLEHGKELRRVHYEVQPQLGWLALQTRWIDAIAGEFVRRTRFDPLHHAHTEQQLWNRLPQWLDELGREPRCTISVEFEGDSMTVEISAALLLDAVAPSYAQLLQLAQRVQTAGASFALLLSSRVAALPGLKEQLAGLRNTHVKVLPPAAGAFGALAFEPVIRRPPQALVLLQRLPVTAESGPHSAAESPATHPTVLQPTHVLFGHQAFALGERPLIAGSAATDAARALSVPAAAGVSRSHCSFFIERGIARLRDHSTYGTFINGQRVEGTFELAAGDRVTLGAPMQADGGLMLIRVVQT
jgi:hypothetical protein